MSNSQVSLESKFAGFAKELGTSRNRVRRFFFKWLKRLNEGETKVKWHGFTVADIVAEFEQQLRKMDEKTLKEMIEDAHQL
jgi:hypothetical protein